MSAPTIDPDTEDLPVGEVDTVVIPLPAYQPRPVYPPRPAPDSPHVDEWALVERAQAGDTAAFGALYDRFLDPVFRFIYFRTGNRHLAEDLTADVFVRALRRIRSVVWQGRSIGAWLITIARNLVADHFKSGKHRMEVAVGDIVDGEREDVSREGRPADTAVAHVTNLTLLTAVKQLNPEQQECIVLRFLLGFSVAETAQSLGKNVAAVKAMQHRAIRSLRRLLPDGFAR